MVFRLLFLIFCFVYCLNASAADVVRSHGVSVFGDLKYPKSFSHFSYVNPDAPKGGTLHLTSIGTFDTLNPFILKGVAATGLQGLFFETLTASAADEAATGYGLIAESMEHSKEGRWIIFTLRMDAKWHDGSAITAFDVAFSFDALKEKGHPFYQAYYRDVVRAKALDRRRVKFSFAQTENRELALIIGQLPILSKAYFEAHDFDKTTLEVPLASGPYRIKSVDPGRSIVYERDPNYWGKDLAVNRGRYNFDEIRIDYYRDSTVAVEALKAGEYDFRRENISKTWNKAYEIEQVVDGRMIKEALLDGTPTGMQAFIFNTRRAPFDDIAFREALQYAYDFEWANRQLFYSAYTRNRSFFGNSEYESKGLPGAAEIALLEPFRDGLPARVFTEEYVPPASSGDGSARDNLVHARDLLREAGYVLKDMKLVGPKGGEPITIEFMITSPSFERVIAPFVRRLKKLGIDCSIRTVDAAQYIKRREEFDFDMMVHWFQQGPMPGNEQINFWHSSKADVNGSMNLIGIRSEAVDAMVEGIVSAKDKAGLIDATRALDRILSWNFYAIPQWHSRTHRVIYWNKFGRPEKTPPYALGLEDTWWFDTKKADVLKDRIEGN